MYGNIVDDTKWSNDYAHEMMNIVSFTINNYAHGVISEAEKFVKHLRYFLESINGINFACTINITTQQ